LVVPGRDIMNGLRTVTTDQACLNMSNSICESVAEIYVEDRASQEAFDTEEIADIDSEEAEQGKRVVSVVTESRTIVVGG
jgi:siroheme synthase